ncbi:MAG TPA: caspase family protein [Candidatus Cloacimonadota bacterium]|nr:caspase family protein [Candidatus Cloacimonadota bacterium]
MKKLFSLVLIALLAISVLPAQKALVISNGGLLSKGTSRPHEDAALIDSTLVKLGWEVQRYSDLDSKSFKTNIGKFAATVEENEPVLVYFSGTAVQIEGKNYLVPQGIFKTQSQFLDAAPELSWILSQISKANMKLVFLDASRTPANLVFRVAEEGLTGIPKIAGNTLLLYSTPLNTIQPDQEGENNHLAQALAKEIQTPDLPMQTLSDRIITQMRILHGGKTPPIPFSISTIEAGWKLNPPQEDGEIKRILRAPTLFRGNIDGGVAPSF